MQLMRLWQYGAGVVLVGGALALAAVVASQSPAAGDEVDSADRDYSADLVRLPPVEPDNALSTFVVEPGFRLELAAAEPEVTDPVALDFDEHGRLYVVEMLGYSEDADDMLGRIRLLEDADRDGRFEKSTVFAEGLAWPTAVLCYDGGVFVGSAPDILYIKDSDGDGRADERRVVFTGFGMSNVQGLLNSFRWGPDNRVHVAVSSCGADLRRADRPYAEPLILRGRNFAFDPKALEFEAASGASQHGFCFDSLGHAFTCQNSDHIQQILIEDGNLSRNPLMRPPSALKSIAVEGPAADVFRLSPVEPWREIRTRLRVKGIVPGVVEGGGRAAGYFTSATGVTIYTGDAWPTGYQGNAFIGDVGSNLVHRKLIERQPNAIPLAARRATPGREFIASRDTWFRPVQFANGPDGNLYVLDMYREVIEHPASLPPVLKKHLDLTSGRDRGRIYRVVRDDNAPAKRHESLSRKLPGDATTAELVHMLGHANGWHRTTAARLLFEQNDPAAIAELVQLYRSEAPAVGRLLAGYLLASFDKIDVKLLGLGVADGDPHVREHAVRLAGRWLAAGERSPEEIATVVKALNVTAGDDDLAVRYQTAFALGAANGDARLVGLAALARRDADDPYMSAAIYSSIAHDADKLLHVLLEDSVFAKMADGRALLVEICRQIGARGDSRELASLAGDITKLQTTDSNLAGALLVAAIQGSGGKQRQIRQQLAEASSGATSQVLDSLAARSLELAADESAEPTARVAAIGSLPLGEYAKAEPVFAELLTPSQPHEVQAAALAALGQFSDADVASPVLEAWPGLSPALRLQAADLLLSRGALAQSLLAAVDDHRLPARELDPSTVQRLKTHADSAVREQAARTMADSDQARSEIVDARRAVLDLAGELAHGREVFRQNCAICHRRDGFGTEVGADLATVITRTPEALLISILDPNREVDPKYLQYTVLTVDGLAKSGMIAAETAASVTLKRAENVTETIPRSDIEQLQSTGMTLMPEGFEKVLDDQSLADLIAYLRSTP